MLQIRRENRLIKDGQGFASGCIADINESSKVKNSLDLVFKVAGSEGEITMHLFPSIVISSRKDDTGKYNLMTQLCLNLGFITEKELADDNFDSEKLNQNFMGLEGQLVKFKTSKPSIKKGDKKATNLEQIDVGTLQLVS